MNTGIFVVIHGNPIDGLDVVGPFDGAEAANEQAENSRYDFWWVTELKFPGEYFATKNCNAVLVHGSPFEGLTVAGPFESTQQAQVYAARWNLKHWWAVNVDAPTREIEPSPGLKYRELFARYAKQQGWDMAQQALVLLAYIGERQGSPSFEIFLQEQVSMESEALGSDLDLS